MSIIDDGRIATLAFEVSKWICETTSRLFHHEELQQLTAEKWLRPA
jgi:hypothetical protein